MSKFSFMKFEYVAHRFARQRRERAVKFINRRSVLIEEVFTTTMTLISFLLVIYGAVKFIF